VLLRFAFEMEVGDLVVHPVKSDSTVAVGRVAGDYEWRRTAPPSSRHRRAVDWLEDGIPREAFSESARYEIGSSITLFRVRRHAREFEGFLERVVA
jgi:predicted Mrr-cat superfamily restriction endonuclease